MEIGTALRALAERLSLAAGRCELGLVGGAALVLLYDARESTKDVDVVPLTDAERPDVFEQARFVADALGLPEDWLNDGAKGYIHGFAAGDVVFDSPTLTVRAASPAQLLAMKLSAWRDDADIEDARLLMTKLSGSRDHVWAEVARYIVPGRELKAHYAFEDLWEERDAAK